ncbi:MAG: hypothetical protein LBI60_00125 [Bacteroidales bacterium]|nr:hypothetical protein [Bacteroidales bacterium]
MQFGGDYSGNSVYSVEKQWRASLDCFQLSFRNQQSKIQVLLFRQRPDPIIATATAGCASLACGNENPVLRASL